MDSYICKFSALRRMLCVLALGVLFPVMSAAQTAATPVPGKSVSIDSGLVSGTQLPNGVHAFLGIPYAAPPVGDLRWREPHPAKAWSGVLAATSYGDACMQPQRKGPGPQMKVSEDCLTLNLWAPEVKPGDKLPVIVYIVGTGYRNGASSFPTISGEMIAKKGVVFVNFNYRMGLFGSLAHPDLTAESPFKSSGAYVHMDEVAVLQWVHRNIARFGGDAANVTLMGQSSGAIDVSVLQASPVVRGLFQRAVAFSGATFPGGPWPSTPKKVGEEEGVKFQQRLGAKSLAEMRAMSAEKLLEASSTMIEEPIDADGYVLPKPAPEILAEHKQNDVPLLLGSCRDEGFSPLGTVKTVEEYQATMRRLAGDHADEILKLYPVTSDAEAATVGMRAAQDDSVGRMMVEWAKAQSSAKAPVYLTLFSYGPPNQSGHGSELAYYLQTLQLPGPPRREAITSNAIELADKLSNALVAFAKTGRPNTGSLQWTKFDPAHPALMLLGEPIQSVPVDAGIEYFIAHPEVRLSSITSARR